MDLLPIHRAILSVTDKTGLVEFVKFLVDNGVELVSTGGTIDAMLELAGKIGVRISVIACILTEHTPWTRYRDIPVVSLAHIPLPGTSLHP